MSLTKSLAPRTCLTRLARPALFSAPLACALALGTSGAASASSSSLADRLAAGVSGRAVTRHLDAFQRIADANGGNRAVGTPGVAASEDYVVRKLKAAGYRPVKQPVPYTRFDVQAERTDVLDPATSLRTLLMDASPPLPDGGITTRLALGPSSGCKPEDYHGMDVRGAVVLVARATCSHTLLVAAAASAGARAVLAYIPSTTPQAVWRLHWFGASAPAIPLASISQQQADWLRAQANQRPLTLHLDWRGRAVSGITHNVIAETRNGDRNHVVVAGGHLDSVGEGPGINDNGSVAAAVLQSALRLAPMQHALTNRVRFIWWGAEELVDVGSDYYVEHLTAAQKQAITLYLNGEMIGSPNYATFVMTGQGATSVPFADYFTAHHLPFEQVPTTAVGSDHEPFMKAGIPVGGIFGGGVGSKTADEVRLFGGVQGQAYDPCYHQACDRTADINPIALDRHSRAFAYAIGWAATTTDPGTQAH
ncbi:M28 family peptidase [Actinomadura rupiterrae]|uniref:M28 family peptidase n=1 Tax=Actinomadura rupiterrae TaxID=559627 RepID=UPI0020A3A193|nr:M28 family peptidase [Actinomadura rupiterrae]MCP2342549.1 N-acetylated-alpha-linked acidic dipeptidase [Actinomadura rupiterrae]